MDVGVGDGGGGALVLADLGADVVREDHRPLEPARAERIADRPLVERVPVGVEEADRDRFHPLVHEAAREPADGLRVRCALDPAVRGEAFVDLEAKGPRHERRGKLDEEVVDVVAGLAAELEDVAEAGRRDESGARPGTLDDRVRGLGGRVDHLADRGRADPAGAQEPPDPLDGPRREVPARRQDLLRGERRPRSVHEDDVGERPPDVDANGEPARALDPLHLAPPTGHRCARAHRGQVPRRGGSLRSRSRGERSRSSSSRPRAP